MPEFATLETRGTFRVNLWITFVGFLDTHLLIPIMALYAVQLGARVGVAIRAPLMGWVAEVIGIKWGLALSSSAAIMAIPIVLISLRRRPI